MAYQSVFKRYELKYLLSREQKEIIQQAMAPYMVLDRYGRTSIRNIYYDTDTYRLIRHSIEKMNYKEKLRIRNYLQADSASMVFVELKKKYNSVVYKRRISLPEEEAVKWVNREQHCGAKTQIVKEIDYFLEYYQTLHPVAFLSYEREAYCPRTDGDFRVTFDENILCRQEELSLESGIWGTPILEEEKTLMEIKCSGGIPLWMTQALSKEHIYKTTYSKYGTAYETMIYPKMKEETRNVL